LTHPNGAKNTRFRRPASSWVILNAAVGATTLLMFQHRCDSFSGVLSAGQGQSDPPFHTRPSFSKSNAMSAKPRQSRDGLGLSPFNPVTVNKWDT
jgi:hypothetical protein